MAISAIIFSTITMIKINHGGLGLPKRIGIGLLIISVLILITLMIIIAIDIGINGLNLAGF